MKIQSYGRYGDSQSASGAKAIEKLVRSRVDELCEEQFARPDYEHYQISVTRSDDWSITAFMQGLVVLERYDHDEPERYLSELPKNDLIALLLDFARSDMDAVLARPWKAGRGHFPEREAFYLLANSPDMSDLHRAVTKGDAEWIEAELKAGADVNITDEDGATPLHWAAMTGRRDVCERLLAAGADPNAVDRNGEHIWEYASAASEYIPKPDARLLGETLKAAARPE